MVNTLHIPEIMAKRQMPSGEYVYGIICHTCSAIAQDYVKCDALNAYPSEVMSRNERMKDGDRLGTKSYSQDHLGRS